MSAFLLVPGAPFYLAALAAALLALLGLQLREHRPLALAHLGSTSGSKISRLLVGQIAGATLAALLITLAFASGAQGNGLLLLLVAALASYLGLGLVFPRAPAARREREAAALRSLTPGFVSFVRVALGSFEAPLAIMRRYIRRPRPQHAPMQELVTEALAVSADLRLRPFAALALVARSRGCRELTDVAEALAQAEAEGTPAETVLAAHQQTLELLLQGEFRRMVRRRTVYLLLMVAISLIVGILINLLFVMTGGGSALMRLG
ncbi:MAG: hypothetical protein AB4911_25425 [Oscillochloridaceae bacterium umkhey_bin13]